MTIAQGKWSELENHVQEITVIAYCHSTSCEAEALKSNKTSMGEKNFSDKYAADGALEKNIRLVHKTVRLKVQS